MTPDKPQLLWQTRPALKIFLFITLVPAIWSALSIGTWGLAITQSIINHPSAAFTSEIAVWGSLIVFGITSIVFYVGIWLARDEDTVYTIILRSVQLILVSSVLSALLIWSLYPLIFGVTNYLFGMWLRERFWPAMLARF